ncbi:MAG: hypothetical protein WCI27_07570 [Candidatus Omnitrophota bacterium]
MATIIGWVIAGFLLLIILLLLASKTRGRQSGGMGSVGNAFDEVMSNFEEAPRQQEHYYDPYPPRSSQQRTTKAHPSGSRPSIQPPKPTVVISVKKSGNKGDSGQGLIGRS